jgi:ribonuclease Z
LLHEATFDDELMGDAKAKLHSTISEALGVAVQMRAKRVVLTHFSQRYHKLPMMQNLNREVMASAGTAGVGEREEEREQESYEGPIDAAVGRSGMDVDVDVVSKHKIDAVDSNSTVNPTTAADSDPPSSNPPATDNDEHPLGTDNDAILKSPQTSPKTSTFTLPPDIQPPPVAVAFDYMRVRVRDIEHMHRFTPALLELYDISGEGKGDGENGGVETEGGGTRTPSRKDIQNVNRKKKSGGGWKKGEDLRKGGAPGTPVEKGKEGENESGKDIGLGAGGGKSEDMVAWGALAVVEGSG